MMNIKLIIALTDDNLIGDGVKLPWHIPDELAHFKRNTQGWPCIFGFNTWISLPKKPLPNRQNVVLTKSKSREILLTHDYGDSVWACLSLESAIKRIKEPQCFICGGKSIYRQALEQDLVDEIILSRIKKDVEQITEPVYFNIDAYLSDFKPVSMISNSEFNIFYWKKK